MAASVKLTAPNGTTWDQPTGLFINNEFVAAQSGETITSIDPACVLSFLFNSYPANLTPFKHRGTHHHRPGRWCR